MTSVGEPSYPKECSYEMDIPANSVLAESEAYRIERVYELAYLVDKKHRLRLAIGDFYGDPDCALIAPDETWFAVGGDGLVYYDFERGIRSFFRVGHAPEPRKSDPTFLHDMRLNDETSIRILLDPWADYASVWRLHVPELSLTKLMDGPSLVDEPWREDVKF